MAFRAPTNGSHTFMHLLQTFLVEVLGHIRANLPDGAEVVTRGRTMLKGALPDQSGKQDPNQWTEFVIELAVRQFEGDMWPHIDVAITADQETTTFDVHPARTADQHARAIVDHLTRLSEPS